MNPVTCPKCRHEFWPTRTGWDVIGRARIAIPPEIAEKFKGVHQPETAVLYAEQMREGTWVPKMPLKFWKTGVMLSGGTRMAAVAQAGIPVEFEVEIIEEFRTDERGREVHHTLYLSEEEVRAIVGVK